MPYRWEHITEDRMGSVGCVCLLFASEYGLMTPQVRELGGLAPVPKFPSHAQARLVVNDPAVDLLSQAGYASARSIQECLVEMWGMHMTGPDG